MAEIGKTRPRYKANVPGPYHYDLHGELPEITRHQSLSPGLDAAQTPNGIGAVISRRAVIVEGLSGTEL
jgi:hypothetical protein